MIALSAPEVKMRINERGVMSISFPFMSKKDYCFQAIKAFCLCNVRHDDDKIDFDFDTLMSYRLKWLFIVIELLIFK